MINLAQLLLLARSIQHQLEYFPDQTHIDLRDANEYIITPALENAGYHLDGITGTKWIKT